MGTGRPRTRRLGDDAGCLLLAGWPQASGLTSLCLRFLLSDRANCTHGRCLSFLACLKGNEAGRESASYSVKSRSSSPWWSSPRGRVVRCRRQSRDPKAWGKDQLCLMLAV